MMGRSAEGLLLLNLLFLLAGLGIVWAIRGWKTWSEVVGLAGLAYMLGLATVSLLGTLVLIFGSVLSSAVVVTLVLIVGASGAATGIFLRRPTPGRPLGLRFESHRLAALVPAGATAAVLYELLRVARIDPLTAWDAWSFWIPKAKAIYFFGGIGDPLFRTLSAPSYPILIPTLNAADFRFMGSADTTALAVQDWLLLIGFVLAAAALLRRLAHPVLVWLCLLLVVALPELDFRLLMRLADLPLDMFFVLAALALARTLVTDERWPLLPFGILLAATMSTKREGQLLAACLVVGAVVAVGLRRRALWIVGVAVAAYVVNVPWRIWWTSRNLTPDTPEGGVLGGTLHLSRAPASFRLVIGLLFSSSLFMSVIAVAIAAAVLAFMHRDRAVAVLFAITLVVGIVGFAWVNWSDPTLPITSKSSLNPTDRAVTSLVLLGLAMTPLLLARSFTAPDGTEAPEAVAVAAA